MGDYNLQHGQVSTRHRPTVRRSPGTGRSSAEHRRTRSRHPRSVDSCHCAQSWQARHRALGHWSLHCLRSHQRGLRCTARGYAGFPAQACQHQEWEKTRDIDNPLNPWVQVYKGELKLEEGANYCDRPPLDIVIKKFRAAKLTAYVAGLLFTILFVCIWPGSMLSFDVMDGYGFAVWTFLSRGWAFIAATFIILVPLIQEIYAIWRQHTNNLKEAMKNDTTNINSNEGNGEINSSTKAGGSKRGVIFHQLQQTASYVIKGSKKP